MSSCFKVAPHKKQEILKIVADANRPCQFELCGRMVEERIQYVSSLDGMGTFWKSVSHPGKLGVGTYLFYRRSC